MDLKQTAFISLYSINLLASIKETECLLRGTDWTCNAMKFDPKVWLSAAEMLRFDTGGKNVDNIINNNNNISLHPCILYLSLLIFGFRRAMAQIASCRTFTAMVRF